MAGTTRTVKRQWSKFSTSAPEDALRVLYEEHNKLITDFATLLAVLWEQRDGFVTSAPGLAIGTTSKKELKNAAFTVQIAGGTEITVASAETAFTATTHDVADGKFAYFTISVQQDGSTITITKGADAASAAAAVRPPTPVNEIYMGSVLIGASGAIFNATTDDLDAAHLTVTYTDAQSLAASDLTAAALSTIEGGD